MKINLFLIIRKKLNFLTSEHLSGASFTADGISKIIKTLDSEKAHGHGMISIRMRQLYF